MNREEIIYGLEQENRDYLEVLNSPDYCIGNKISLIKSSVRDL